MQFDFSGYATKNNLRCTDGVTIRNGAFSECDGEIVPLVWQHLHDDPSNVLGKAFLEHREDGVYAYCQFNNTEKARNAKELVSHGDINSMSIYATKVVRNGNNVTHGSIKEVSLVLAPANPGAKIEPLSIAHGDGTYDELEDEFIIRHSGEIDEYAAFDLEVDLYDQNGNVLNHANDEESKTNDNETVEDVFNTLSEKQKNAVYYILAQAIEDAKGNLKQSDEGGQDMKFNAFEQNGNTPAVQTLSHSDIEQVATMTFDECKKGVNFKIALQHAAATYGIQDIETLFPDAKDLNNRPEFVKRRTEWVNTVLSGTKHTPFSRIRSRFADITADEARARGYIKGNKKVEEVFPVMQRSTTPQTIYKLQKLDRDDILDITDFDVVAWLRAEMRVMLDEELARAVLIGDGREISSPDKIKEEHIRPIWTDDDFYAYKLRLPKDKAEDMNELADAFIRSRLHYEGTGRPVAFMAPETITELMLQRDGDGYRLYKTEAELADGLRVTKMVEVPLFYGKVRAGKTNVPEENGKFFALKAIIVNLNDYTMGADKGGQVTNFDDFDIDYNQYKYLIETRCSGALTGFHSAVIIEVETDGPEARSLSGLSSSRKISV